MCVYACKLGDKLYLPSFVKVTNTRITTANTISTHLQHTHKHTRARFTDDEADSVNWGRVQYGVSVFYRKALS